MEEPRKDYGMPAQVRDNPFADKVMPPKMPQGEVSRLVNEIDDVVGLLLEDIARLEGRAETVLRPTNQLTEEGSPVPEIDTQLGNRLFAILSRVQAADRHVNRIIGSMEV